MLASNGVWGDPENPNLFAWNRHSKLAALGVCAIRGSSESHSSWVYLVHDEARRLRRRQAQCQFSNLFHRPGIDQKNKASVASDMRVPSQGFGVALENVTEMYGTLEELVVLPRHIGRDGFSGLLTVWAFF